MSTVTSVAVVTELGQHAGQDLVERHRPGEDRQHAGLQAAQVEQVVHQSGQPVQRLVGRRQQLVPLGSVQSTSELRRLVTDAFAEASGDRRSWPTARSSAVRSLSASASGLASAAASLSRARSTRAAACAAKAPTSRRSSAASDRPCRTRTRSSRAGNLGVAVLRAAAGRRTGRGDRSPGLGQLVVVHPLHQAGAGHPEGLADALQQRRQGGLAAQHGAGQGRQGLGLGRGAGRLPGTAGGPVDHRAHQRRDQHEDAQRQGVVRLGDGEGPGRRGEEVVQYQRCRRSRSASPARDRRPGRPRPRRAGRPARCWSGSGCRRRGRAAAPGPAAARPPGRSPRPAGAGTGCRAAGAAGRGPSPSG